MRCAAQVKDRTIDALAAALDAREEALERHAAGATSLEVRTGRHSLWRKCLAADAWCSAQEVHARILQLQQRTAAVEAEAERRTAAARRYKAEARQLRGDLAAAQAARSEAHGAAVALEQRLTAALVAERGAAEQAASQAAQALAAEREATKAALRRAEAAEADAAAAREQLAEAERVRTQLARILQRHLAPAAAAD